MQSRQRYGQIEKLLLVFFIIQNEFQNLRVGDHGLGMCPTSLL